MVQTVPFSVASVVGSEGAWIVWLLIGAATGVIANRLVDGNRLGGVGNIVVGILGGIFGGLLLTASDIDLSGPFLTYVTAFLGAVVLLILVHIGGRGRQLGGSSGV